MRYCSAAFPDELKIDNSTCNQAGRMGDEGTKTKDDGERQRRENDGEGKKGFEEGERRRGESW